MLEVRDTSTQVSPPSLLESTNKFDQYCITVHNSMSQQSMKEKKKVNFPNSNQIWTFYGLLDLHWYLYVFEIRRIDAEIGTFPPNVGRSGNIKYD